MYSNVKQVFIILLFNLFFVSKVNGYHSLDYALKNAIKDTSPYQITLFTSDLDSKDFTKNVSVFSEFSTLRLGLNHRTNKTFNFASNLTILKKTLQTSLIVIYADDIYFARQVIHFFASILPMYERPKCLCILSNKHASFESLNI